MSYKIEKHLTVRNKGNRGGNKPQWLVIHYVGATGQAWANANYFHSVYRGSSAHYFIDKGNIVQVVEDNTPAWHVGDGSRTSQGKYNGYKRHGATNFNSIGFELCLDTSTGSRVQEMDFHEGTLKRAEWLIKQKQKQYNIPNERIIRHYDVSGKNCPGNWRANDWQKWKEFKARLAGESYKKPNVQQKPKPNTSSVSVGQRVVLSNTASKYATGQNIPSSVKGKTYTIQQVGTDRVLLKEIYSWVYKKDVGLGGSSVSVPKPENNEVKVGQRVTLSNSANKYATGQNIPSSVRGKTYTVQQVKNDRVLLKEIYSWVYKKDVGLGGNTTNVSKPKTSNIRVGGRVTLSNSASKYATGQSIPTSVKGKTYTIQQVKSDRVLLKEIYSWVYRKDVR